MDIYVILYFNYLYPDSLYPLTLLVCSPNVTQNSSLDSYNLIKIQVNLNRINIRAYSNQSS